MGLLNDNHVYSYSQINSFDECPYSFYLQRIEKTKNLASNAWAERGTLIHDLLDQWAKGNLKKEDMVSEYDRRYGDEVVTAFPPFMKNQASKAYQSGIDFLKNFDEFKGYKIISSEEKFTVDLMLNDGSTRKFTGVIDLILRREWTNELIICDHKSKSADAFKKAEKEMWKQQYLYSQYVYEQYGEWPAELMFHLFGDDGSKPTKPFDLKEFRDSIKWAGDCISRMESFTMLDWLSCKDSSDFYCQNLCSPRWECPKSVEKPLTKKEKEELKLQQENETNKYLFVPEDEPIQEEINEFSHKTEEDQLKCENCGAPYVSGKRKCPQCKAWYKVRKIG